MAERVCAECVAVAVREHIIADGTELRAPIWLCEEHYGRFDGAWEAAYVKWRARKDLRQLWPAIVRVAPLA